MVAKFCCRSHGQPVPGVRSAAMMSRSRTISREGVMDRTAENEWRTTEDTPPQRVESFALSRPSSVTYVQRRVIPGRATDLGLARDRRLKLPKSATADLGGASPESIIPGGGYGFRARR